MNSTGALFGRGADVLGTAAGRRKEYLVFTQLIEDLVQRDAMPRRHLLRRSVEDDRLARIVRLGEEDQ
jgi:hypothetical protein